MGDYGGTVSTNRGRAATSKDLPSTNREEGILESMKRKVEPQVGNCKRRWENTNFGPLSLISNLDKIRPVIAEILLLFIFEVVFHGRSSFF